ncbi:GAF domain-containing protein [Mesorhizobium sp. CAU 1741]|uniref:sensor histidine kinase n=1 Tax=Mesorhizobium sp. CAU 1741 TaxID=3140366 RepID=UPI00325A785D
MNTNAPAQGRSGCSTLKPDSILSLDEALRSATLHSYDILDTPQEPEFDDIAELAAEVCGTPIAVVNLVDTHRQFFKAEVGLGVRETPLETSFCGHAILMEDMMVVNDAREDARFDGNPLVHTDGGLRFYAGALLKTRENRAIGTVCVLDTVPRELDAHQLRTLKLLARQVMTQLELRRSLAVHAAAVQRLSALMELGERLRHSDDLAEMGRIAGEIVGRMLNVSRAGFGRIDQDARTIRVDGDWQAQGQASLAGTHALDETGPFGIAARHGRDLIVRNVDDDVETRDDPGPLRALGVGAMVDIPLISRGRTVAVFFVHDAAPRDWSVDEIDFIRSVADRVQVSVTRLRAQQDQSVLNQELNHRLKNTLAMVQAIATQTLRNASDRPSVDAFVARLHALSTAHDVLVQRSWSAAPIREVVARALSAFQDDDRFEIDGPAINIGPRATLALTLLLHELATNAAKYGALSTSDGTVRIGWRLAADGVDPDFTMEWSEHGGPPVTAPARNGFGSRLIKLGLVGTGGVDISYEARGLHARMQAKLSQLQQS